MNTTIAGFSLDELLKQYHENLFDDFLPFMDEYIIDHQHGGFKCNTDRAGNNITKNKRTWFDGRGVWVYSYLYNNFKKDPQYLEIAKKTIDLLFKAKRDYALWPWAYDQFGNDLKERNPDIYGDLFVAEGLIEYSIATGDVSYIQQAKDIIFNCVELYDSEDYLYDFDYRPDVSTIRKPRVLGHWMIMLSLSKSILKHEYDADIEALSDRCLDALLNHHLNPEFGLMVEFLEKDLSLPKDGLDQFVYIGHAIESLWMIMDEAIRRNDHALFNKSCDLFKYHVEVAWDDVYGGVFHGLENVNENKWLLEKVLWAQQEVLIGLMMIIEFTDDEWAYRWFDKAYNHVINTYPLKKHGYRLWNIGGDRKMTFQKEGIRIENYHTPRHLMLNIQLLNKIKAKWDESYGK
ncbi:AGE family epimerase/isomerase [Pseudopedobacter sp.]|uniref:AGE family epimerase/isomerase n=1 Tax=Pseudopedobacter sp. TaxID=1936787 RepID=UPI00334184C1